MAGLFDEVMASGGWSDAGGYVNNLGQIDPYRSRWTSGSWSGLVGPGPEVGGPASDPMGSQGTHGFQYNPSLIESGWWNQQGFQGNAFQTGEGEYRFDQPTMTPELAAWAAENGYTPGYTEGYGGILKNGVIQPGTAQGNRTNDDLFMAAALVAGGVVGSAAYGAAGAGAAGAGAGAGAAGGTAMTAAEQIAFLSANGMSAADIAIAYPSLAASGGLTGVGGGVAAAGAAGAGASAGGSGGGTAATGGGGSASSTASSWLEKISTGASNMSGKDWVSIISGIYGMKLSRDAQKASDPFGQYRAGYGQQLAALEANPNLITGRPGWRAGIDLIDRQMGARGYLGSGNNRAALSRYAGDFYDKEMGRLAGLAGANAAPGAGRFQSAELAGQSLASIGYGLAPYFKGSGGGSGGTSGSAVGGDLMQGWGQNLPNYFGGP